MYDTLEDLRVFSQLSEGCHYIDIENEKFTCIGGYVLPYHISIGLMLWVMMGTRSYELILCDTIQIESIIKLNPHDTQLLISTDTASVVNHIYEKIQSVMRTWSVDEFECILPDLVH